jgi:hypothetical protein
VEGCFTEQGSLLPNFHKFFWAGLRTGVLGTSWPHFTWLDREEVIHVGDYQHWGVYQPGFILEPNNMLAPEFCGGSNLTMGTVRVDRTYMFDGLGGWADRPCGEKHPYICEVQPVQGAAMYTSPTTGNTFSFNAHPKNQSDAEYACNEAGGHLASYADVFEQAEVEKYFADEGVLMAAYHKAYWLGLVAIPPPAASVASARPSSPGGQQTPFASWRWLDFLPPPGRSTYQHWGTLTLANGKSRVEPNNLAPPEACAAANASQAYDDPAAWGWADANCALKLPSICKLVGERLRADAAAT